MQKKVFATGLATLLIASLLLAPVSPSFGHGIVDQSFVGSFIGPGGSSSEAFGQSFTPTADNLIGVDIFFFLVSLDRNITIEIREGSLDGPLLGSSTKMVSAGSDKIEHFDFSLTPLTPGNTYVIRTAASLGEFLWLIAPDNAYLGGTALGLGFPCGVVGCDFGFQTYFFDTTPFPGTNGNIVFSSLRDGNSEIYVMDANGGAQTRVTNNPAYDWAPSWSADGTRIAFESTRDGNSEIYVMNANGGAPTRVTNDPAFDGNPSWSPDGKWIVFERNVDGQIEIFTWGLEDQDDAPRRLTNNLANDYAPDWSPDGTKIAFASTRDGNFEIYVMDKNGATQTNLSNDPALDSDPSWSPDSGKIAFESVRDGNTDIYVMNANGGAQTRLTDDPAFDVRPSWSADGTKIAFESDRDGNHQIYVMDANGATQTNLSNNPGDDQGPDWQPAPDIDGDGIFNGIDTQPNTFSSDFSNVPLGGATTGTVLSLTGSFELFNSLQHIPGVEYVDPLEPGDNVQISACSGAMILTASDGDNFVMTCGSATLQVLTGPVEEILIGSDGSTASATIGTGSTLTFYPDTFTFSTPSSNTDPIIITKDGLQFPLPPNSNIKPVNIDVKPGEKNPATINLKIEKTIAVAILGDVYLDVGQIDRTLSTLKFGDSLSATPATATKTSLKDVNLDGRMDLVAHFKLSQTNLSLGDTMGCIKGQMKQAFGGATIEDCDAVRLIQK